jgi:hypothetical protein
MIYYRNMMIIIDDDDDYGYVKASEFLFILFVKV